MNSPVRRYTLGFVFAKRPSGHHVLLLRKARPAGQAGRFNGVGGKLEAGETPHECMAREAEEEVGLKRPPAEWRRFGSLSDEGFFMDLFMLYVSSEDMDRALAFSQRTDEPADCFGVLELMLLPEVLPNIPYLVQMALSFERGERAAAFEIREVHLQDVTTAPRHDSAPQAGGPPHAD